jgi:hypothetical protein
MYGRLRTRRKGDGENSSRIRCKIKIMKEGNEL